jgi:hypothetical protein
LTRRRAPLRPTQHSIARVGNIAGTRSGWARIAAGRGGVEYHRLSVVLLLGKFVVLPSIHTASSMTCSRFLRLAAALQRLGLPLSGHPHAEVSIIDLGASGQPREAAFSMSASSCGCDQQTGPFRRSCSSKDRIARSPGGPCDRCRGVGIGQRHPRMGGRPRDTE